MKGPYERLKYDLRRVFECPRCGRRVRMAGSVTFVTCHCAGNAATESPAWMRLVEDEPRRTDGQQLAVRSRWPTNHEEPGREATVSDNLS